MDVQNPPKIAPRILVCDDDVTVRLLTRQCLESEGMTVLEAASGVEALDTFARERPDLVFLDVEMPGMSGLEVCERIRAMPQGEAVPIMIVTGSDDRESIDQGFDAGATQYKTKPVNWSLLGRDVQYMLRASNAFSAVKRQEDRLRYLAFFDPLTSLPNRRSFNEQLARIIKHCQRRDSIAALLFIDLDNFKRINDSIGHSRGDHLLVEIARRLTNELRQDDAISYFTENSAEEKGGPDAQQKTHDAEIARLGGDEFTVVLADVEDVDSVERVARRILGTLSQPIPLQSHNPVVTPSIGIAIYPTDGTDPDTLVRNADTAMYAAKSDGRGRYRFYNEQMNARSVEQLKMEEELRHAMRNNELELRYQPQVHSVTGEVVGLERLSLESDLWHAASRNELVVHYQPIVELESGKLHALEALVRWRHPQRGMIAPNYFVPVAEKTGQILELGEWVLSQAATDCAYWAKLGYGDFRVAINISPLQFNQTNLHDYITSALERSGLPAQRVELEFTESAIMDDAKSNILKLNQLKASGIGLAVDDFGTGYSSLSYLKRFPIDTLKIDQSFVADMATPDGAAIVDAILALAQALKIKVIAEGIETREQMQYLVQRKCDLLQGYYFARPVTAGEIPAILETGFSELLQ